MAHIGDTHIRVTHQDSENLSVDSDTLRRVAVLLVHAFPETCRAVYALNRTTRDEEAILAAACNVSLKVPPWVTTSHQESNESDRIDEANIRARVPMQQTLLSSRAAAGDEQGVEKLLVVPLVNVRAFSDVALVSAARAGHAVVVRQLLAHRSFASVVSVHSDHSDLKSDHLVDFDDTAVDAGAGVAGVAGGGGYEGDGDPEEQQGAEAALLYASANRHASVVEILLRAFRFRSVVRFRAAQLAATSNSAECVRLLLVAASTTPSLPSLPREHKFAVLASAAAAGSVDTFQFLVQCVRASSAFALNPDILAGALAAASTSRRRPTTLQFESLGSFLDDDDAHELDLLSNRQQCVAQLLEFPLNADSIQNALWECLWSLVIFSDDVTDDITQRAETMRIFDTLLSSPLVNPGAIHPASRTTMLEIALLDCDLPVVLRLLRDPRVCAAVRTRTLHSAMLPDSEWDTPVDEAAVFSQLLPVCRQLNIAPSFGVLATTWDVLQSDVFSQILELPGVNVMPVLRRLRWNKDVHTILSIGRQLTCLETSKCFCAIPPLSTLTPNWETRCLMCCICTRRVPRPS